MATITVTSLSDTTAADGETTLREALAIANGTAAADQIVFASGLSGTISLVEGSLTISEDVTIAGDVDGDGTGDITIDAGGASRVLNVTDGGAGLSGLTLTGGYATSAGGGIAVAGSASLTLTNSRVTANTAYAAAGGGIYTGGGTITLNDSRVDGNMALYASGGGSR